MLINRLIFFLCFWVACYLAYAQANEKDSLLTKVKTLPNNEEKVKVHLRLSEIFIDADDSLCFDYARSALQLSRELSYETGIGNAYDKLARSAKRFNNNEQALHFFDSALLYFQSEDQLASRGMILNQMGILELNRNNYESSRNYYQQSLEAYQQIDDSAHIANEYLNIGITYEIQGIYSSALDYYFKCLSIDEKMGYQKGIASDYMSIALIFKKQKNLPSAIEYYQKALDISEEIGDYLSQASVLTNLGIIYKDQGKYDLALQVQEKAIQTFKRLNHLRGLIVARHNIAVIYFKKGDLDQSMRYLEASTETVRSLGNELYELTNNMLKARIYLKQNLLDKATTTALDVLEKTKEVGLLAEQHEVTVLLSQIYEANDQPWLALQMMEKSTALQDSIYNVEKAQQMQELQTKYETTQKENQIELLSKEKALQESELKRKSLQQNMMFGGIGLFALVGFILFRMYTSRQKQKRLLLDQQLKNEKLEAERLQELDEAKSRFFANIAHEFRTPLTLILGPSEQIMEGNKDPKSVENAHLIKQNADKLLSFTNQLLDLSKLESGMIKLHPVRDDFVALVKGCVHSFESLAEEKDINLVFNTTLDKLVMDFDTEKTAIIINNLIANAMKFTMPFGDVNVSISTLSSSNEELKVVLQVTDTGIGISEQQLPYIFDRFYQIDDSVTRKTQGTGIGLALTKELVELHNGEISVSSEEGKGTCFTIRLPENQNDTQLNKGSEVEALASDGEQWDEVQIDKDLSGSVLENNEDVDAQTVLVIEDNPEVRKFIVNILRGFYHVIEAENGVTGLKMTIDEVPDLVISDVMMPEMDGFGYCRAVKNDERTSHIPVIMLTAKAGIDNKIEGLDTGADDYLAKPFNAKELLARIKNLIQIRQRLQEKFGQTKDASHFAKRENEFITKLEGIIEENIDKEAFNVVDLCKASAMSRTQLHRKLRALTNLSTTQFIRQYKLKKSVELLKSGEYNVSEVAYMLGFNTPNFFSTCFHKQFGYAPSDVIKSVSQK